MNFKIDNVVRPITPSDASGNTMFYGPYRVHFIEQTGIIWLDSLYDFGVIGHGIFKVRPDQIELANGEFDEVLRDMLNVRVNLDVNGIIPFIQRYFRFKS